MGNIVLLDDLTINKIAAGEVIERPASVVKEMLENAIDAGSKIINVEIKNGGISLIKIADDGCGITEDDMEIAFERHATSKIRKADDLKQVMTMGFRGEALASIAAVSKVEMISKSPNEDVAHRIVVEGGKTIEFSEATRSKGTTIVVQNLFYNTPVRYKFLKKDYTEAGHVEDAVARIALVNRDVAIKLISNGKTIIKTNGKGDLKSTIYSIYGKDISKAIQEVDFTYEGIHITGAIGNASIARGNRANQLFFINGRYVKDKNLTAAADKAFKGTIPSGRFAFIVLNMEMDTSKVDVNVHPAKLEVRFQDESQVLKAVYHAINSTLLGEQSGAPTGSGNILEDIYASRKEKLETSEEDDILKVDGNHDDSNEQKEVKLDEVKAEINENLEVTKELEEKEEKTPKTSTTMSNQEKIAKFISDYHKSRHYNVEKLLKGEDEIIDETPKTEIEEKDESKEEIKEEPVVEPKEETNEEPVVEKDNVEENKIDTTTEFISKDERYENSLTKKIDTDDVNELIKSINDDKEKLNMQVTQIIESARDGAEKEEGELKENSTETIASDDSTDVQEESIPNAVDTPEKRKIKIFAKAKDDMEKFTSFAESLIVSKIDNQGTQLIDTNKVREAINDSKKTEAPSRETYEELPEFAEMYKKTFGVEPFSVRKERKLREMEKEKYNATSEFSYATENVSMFEKKDSEIEEIPEIPYKYVGQAFGSYVVVELKNEMYVVDIAACKRRIVYENLKEKYYNDDNDSQSLLLPDVIVLSKKEQEIARENVEIFNNAGFKYEDFGENTIKLVSVPGVCEDLNTKQLFVEILDKIDTVAVIDTKEKEEKFLSIIALKIVSNEIVDVDDEQSKEMITKLLRFKNPFTGTDGKPIAIKMTKYDLDKKFSRR